MNTYIAIHVLAGTASVILSRAKLAREKKRADYVATLVAIQLFAWPSNGPFLLPAKRAQLEAVERTPTVKPPPTYPTVGACDICIHAK